MVNLFRFKIWLQTMISLFFAHFSTLFPKFRSQILQYQTRIGILLKYFQIPFQICRLNQNRFRNGELVQIQNLALNNDFTIFAHFSTPFPQFRSQILQYQPLIGILLKYFQIPIQICRLNGNGFTNGDLVQIQNLASKNDFTIFRKSLNTISQILQPNIAIPTSHRYTLKVLSNTYPNMPTIWKWVKNWRPCSDSKSGFKE